MTIKHLLTILILLISKQFVFSQCANSSNIYSFVYNGKTYEVIKENKTWINAATCAVERGGILIEVNDVAEQNAVFTELNTNAGIITNNTTAPDGGGGSYVWIGGNDIAIEGNWGWDGNNDNNMTQFWMGTASGNSVGGLYNNWGNEPDDFNGQDALGLSLNGWPLGTAGQWNDVDKTNTLYYVVEYSSNLSINDNDLNNNIQLFPNPFNDFITIESNDEVLSTLVILNSLGEKVNSIDLDENVTSETIDLSNLDNGIYFIQVIFKNGESSVMKIMK